MKKPDPVAHNPEAERWTLGLILLDRSGANLDEAVSRLRPTDFGSRAHARIFAAMAELHREQEPVDDLTVIGKLTQQGQLENVGGIHAVSGLDEALPFVDIVPKIEIVRGYAKRRAIGHWAQDVLNCCLDPTATLEDVEAMLEPPGEATPQPEAIQPLKAVLTETVHEIHNQHADRHGLPGWTTTLRDLNESTTGIRPTELWVVGAIPGAGKTALLGQIGLANAKAGVPVGVFSLEMSARGLAARLLSVETRVGLMRFRNPRLMSPENLLQVDQAAETMGGYPIHFDETAGLPLAALRARARLMVRRYGVRLLFVDYLQLVEAEGESRRERVATVARALKNLAKELHIGVVAASQLSRPQKGSTARPTMLDLKESGEIEAAADTVLLIHRPSILQQKGEEELIIGKQRNGPVGSIGVWFDEAHSVFHLGAAAESGAADAA